MRLEGGLRGYPAGCAHAGGGWLRDRQIDPGARAIAAHPDHLPDGRIRGRALGVSRLRGGGRGLHRQAAGAGNPEIQIVGFCRSLQQECGIASGDSRTQTGRRTFEEIGGEFACVGGSFAVRARGGVDADRTRDSRRARPVADGAENGPHLGGEQVVA